MTAPNHRQRGQATDGNGGKAANANRARGKETAVVKIGRTGLKSKKEPHLDNFLSKWSDIIARIPSPPRPSLWRHKKRGGTYRLVGTAQVQCPEDAPLADYEVVQIYVGEDGEMWVRRKAEFFDGRFEEIPQPSKSR